MSSERDVRLQKLQKLKELGFNPYHDRFEKTHSLSEANDLPDGTQLRVSGRLITRRSFGKLIFAKLADKNTSFQISFDKKILDEIFFQIISKLIDIGDFIGIEGEMWTTQKGERTIQVLKILPLSKALRPLPEKWHGLQDKEACYRQRYLDLIANNETKKRFILRSNIISFIRRYLDENDFLEVETPILQAASSGAAARPFITHHNALDRDFFLRISPETYLKRLMVGGLDRVYEIGKNFRNEGVDQSHLQEFTMLEWYTAYWNYKDNMLFVRKLIQAILKEFLGTAKIIYQGQELDFDGKWPEVSFCDVILEKTNIDINQIVTYKELAAEVNKKCPEIEINEFKSYPALIDGLYKKVVRPKLIQPTFLLYHPTMLVPLARRNEKNPNILDMFQVVVNSWEIVKAYSELIDPIDQYNRMLEQQSYKDQGDDEVMMMEEDYILCMEYGMPPMSGLGLGIDRLVAILSNTESLRDVIFFPTLREK